MNTSNNEQPRKKVGLAIGGGFIRATAGIGVIEVLEENNIPIDIVAGCSSGSAVAASYCVGTMANLKKRVTEGSRKDYWKVIFEPAIPREGFLKGERNRKFFEEFVGDKTFADAKKKLILLVTDLVSMKEVTVTEGHIGQTIQACTAVPGLFVPVKRDGRVLVDGGNFNLIPSKVLYQNGADYVIAVHTSQLPSLFTRFFSNLNKMKKRDKSAGQINNDRKDDLNIFQVIWRGINLSVFQIKNFYHHNYPYNILIKPGIEEVKRWHTNSAAYCVKQGRKAALEAIPQIKKDLGL